MNSLQGSIDRTSEKPTIKTGKSAKRKDSIIFDYPFPALPSFRPSIIILTFFGYQDKIKLLLDLLCHHTHIFFLRHIDMLDEVFFKWSPEYKGLLEFGCLNQSKAWNHETLP